MRKSFTRLFSIFILLCGLSLQIAYSAVGIAFDPVGSKPKNGDANVKPADVATKFVVAFTAAPTITAAGGTAVLYKNGGLYKTYPVTTSSSSVQVVGQTLEITHGLAQSSFVQGDVYSIAITDGAITSLAAGALAQNVYAFTIGDWVNPGLVTTAASYTPAKGAIDVMANLDGSAFVLKVPFNEAVTVPTSTNAYAVYIYQDNGTVVDIIKVGKIGATTLCSDAALTTPLNAVGASTVYIPVASTAIFKENTKYYVKIDANAFVDVTTYLDGGITKRNSMPFAGLSDATTWTFTTRDNTAPIISAKSVTSIADVSATLNVTLSEKGKYYYSVSPSSAAAPTSAQVIAGTAPGQVASGSKTVSAAATNVTASISGLTGGVEYVVYIVTENSVTVGAAVTSATPATLTFKTVDNTAPTEMARGTLVDSSKKTYALYMVFNEQVKGQTGNLDLRLNSNDSYVKTVGASNITSRAITADEVTANTFGAGRNVNEYVVLIDLGATLPSKVNYYITFPATYIEDMAGNDFAGAGFGVPINKGDWAFTSSDFEVPVVTVAWANASSLTSAINITFDETVYKQLASTADWGEVIALEKNNVAVPFTIVPPGATPTAAITLNPTVVLDPNTDYVLRLRNDAVKDISDNAITTEINYTLRTGDLAPFAVSYGSSLGATTTTNLVGNSTIVIDFNKTVKVNTTGTTWVAATADNLKPLLTFTKGGTAKAFTVAYDAVNFTLTITPTDALVSFATDYSVTLDGSKVKDSQGVLLNTAAGYVAAQAYSVKDYNAPVAVASHTGNVSNDVAHATPKITFTDDNLGTLTDLSGTALTALAPADLAKLITFKSGSSNGANLGFTAAYAGGVITITPTIALVSDNTYYYGIGASVKDVAGNVSTGVFSTFKAVAPTVAPTISALTYGINGGTQTDVTSSLINIVPNSSNKVVLSVTFNDFVKEFTGNPVTLTDGTNTWNINITSANVSGKVLTVEFPTGAAIASDAVCTVTLPAALVQGSNYIAGTTTFAQFAGKIITFNSKDIVKPTASANTPSAGASAVALNTDLKINFDEKVVLGTGNILIKEGTTVVQTIPVNATNVSLDATGTIATIIKTGDLIKYNTTYTLEVPVTAFTDDISLNQLSAVYSGTFTTLVNPQPVVSALTPADNSDRVALSPLTLGITFSEDVVKYDPLSGTRRLWYLIKEGSNGIRCSFNGANDLIYNSGNDEVVASNYIETSSVGISGKEVSIATGFTPVAGIRYYVLITPGAFLDKSTGTTALGSPVPGVFGGITLATTWNFTTIDENAGTVAFAYTLRPDNLVATTSNITITFSRPIVKGDGSAINDADVANLFTLSKTAGPGTPGTKAFIGTISADKKVITILNSSLVTLGEMTPSSTFSLAMNPAAIKYANGAAVTGAATTFTTSNYTTPSVNVSIAAPIADILKDKATIQFAVSPNTLSYGVQTNMKKLYYTIEAGSSASAAMTAAVIKLSSTNQDLTGVAPLTKTYQFTGLSEETSYVVYAVVEDEAGNISPVSTIIFTTDDVTKPTLAVKPTSFDSNKKLTFEFSEAVTVPGGNLAVRILDKATLTEVAKLNLSAVAGVGNEKKLITDAFTGLSTSDAIVNYYVEIDADIVADVPVVAGDATNKFAGLFRTDCEVSSKDVTAPLLVSSNPSLPASDVNTTFSIQLTFSEPVQKVATIPVAAFVVEKEITPGVTYEAFEVVDPANVVTNGTNVVSISVSRTLASKTTYRLSVNTAAFKDLAGNVCTSGTQTGIIVTKDVVAPTVTFNPVNNATAIAAGPAVLTLTFNEPIRLLDNTVIDRYDLNSLVWVKKGTDDIPFTATINPAATVITITPTAALVTDATYSYGFKAEFEDSYNNVVPAASASFKTVVTSPAAQYLTWTPTKVAAAPWSWLGTKDAVTLKFSSNVFTHSTVAAQNNMPVSTQWLTANCIVVEQDGVVVPIANLVFTVVDNQTFTIAPKTNWGSYSLIEVKINGGTLQVNEGDNIVLGTVGTIWDSAKFQAEDTVDPIVDILTAPAPFVGGKGYLPDYVGVDGATPVYAKTETLKLYFNEDVKVGTGTYEIYRWDGKFITSGSATVASDKRTVSFGSLAELPTNVEYFVIVNPSAVVDVHDNNPYAGITTVKAWKFLLKDTATPAIAAYLPNTDNIPVDRDLTISFDRPVVLGNGYVALYTTVDGGSAVQLWRSADNGTTNAFTISGNTVTVNLSTLEPKTTYYVELAEGTLVSAADPTISASGKDRASWTFTTETNDVPLASTFVPAKGATKVSLGSDLKITFDQNVVAGTGDIQLMVKQATGGYINNVTPISVTDATKVIFKDNTLTIPASVLKLSENSDYYVIIPAGAVKNTSYTPEYFAGILVPFAWSFSTVTDATAPTVTVTAPVAPIAKVFSVGLQFSEPVTGVASGVTVTNGTFVVSGSGAQYTVTVTSEEQKTVTIVLANTITDLATPANAFVGATLTYTTADMTAPKAVATTPTGTLTNNHPTLVVTFDENVVFGAGSLNIYKKSDNTLALSVPVTASMVSGKVATVTYTYDATKKNGLDKNTDYYVLADAGLVKDLAGNAFAGITASSTWTFKTGDFATDNRPEVNNSLEFKVYPNPFVDYVTVSNASELSKVVISNIAGQVVKEVVYPDGTIQLNELRSGVYFVTLYQDNEVVSTVKLLKR